jgi:hypothetical protein
MRPTTELPISCIHAIYPSAIDFCYDSLPQPTFETVLIAVSYLQSEQRVRVSDPYYGAFETGDKCWQG